MEMIRIASDNIESIGYEDKTNVLRIEFKDDSLYEYVDVPSEIYADLMRSVSKGRYARMNIYDQYSCRQIR